MDDLSDVVDSMITDTYALTRRSPSSYVDGRLQPSTNTVLSFSASVQPAMGRDLQRLPEGMRTAEIRAIFTTFPLLTQGAGQDPDIVAIEGDAYEVQTVEAWGNVGGFYKALALKLGH